LLARIIVFFNAFRELGSNIPRGKIFKMYRGNTEQLLRCRSKIDDLPEGCIASGTSGPFKALSPVHPMLAVRSEGIPLSAAKVDLRAADDPRCSTECGSSLNVDVESASSDEVGMTSDESNPSLCDAKGENAASPDAPRDYYIGPNEPVFIGTKRYSEHFIFWQVSYRVCICRKINSHFTLFLMLLCLADGLV